MLEFLLLGSCSANATELNLAASSSFDSLALLVLLVRLTGCRGDVIGGTTHTCRLGLTLDSLKIDKGGLVCVYHATTYIDFHVGLLIKLTELWPLLPPFAPTSPLADCKLPPLPPPLFPDNYCWLLPLLPWSSPRIMAVDLGARICPPALSPFSSSS